MAFAEVGDRLGAVGVGWKALVLLSGRLLPSDHKGCGIAVGRDRSDGLT